jgi:hypothetical protein
MLARLTSALSEPERFGSPCTCLPSFGGNWASTQVGQIECDNVTVSSIVESAPPRWNPSSSIRITSHQAQDVRSVPVNDSLK